MQKHHFPKYSIYCDVIGYSPIRRQWLVALNTTGRVEDLHPWSWHDSKVDAIKEALKRNDFRLGFTADCTNLYRYMDLLNNMLKEKTK